MVMRDARAVLIDGAGTVEVLKLGEIKIREPGPGEVLVKVVAAGLNRADILQRRGFYPAPAGVASDIPGLEYAGTIEQTGPETGVFHKGERVMGIMAGGAMATHVIVSEREVIPVPTSLDLVEAAAIPEVFVTAYDALFVQGQLCMGQVGLIHAVGSGVGTAAVQLSTSCGARTIGTSRTREKLDSCTALGLTHGILVENKSFIQDFKKLPGMGNADLILDSIGAAYLNENIEALTVGGRLVIIGLMGGAQGQIALGNLLQKRIQVYGSVLRSRPPEQKAILIQSFIRNVLPLFESKRIKPIVQKVMSMDEIRTAHTLMENDQTFGKIVLSWE